MEEIDETKLDNPLVVHIKTDASYQENQSAVEMHTTHTDEDANAPTLERHRFRKEKKKKKSPYILAFLVVIAVIVVSVLYAKGIIGVSQKETEPSTRKSYTTEVVNTFENTITIKGTYIFYEGTELDDIGSLESEVKYLDEGTQLTVQDEHADSTFLNSEVLPLLETYSIEYSVTHIQSSGLISKYETTAAQTETTAQTSAAAESQTASSEQQ